MISEEQFKIESNGIVWEKNGILSLRFVILEDYDGQNNTGISKFTGNRDINSGTFLSQMFGKMAKMLVLELITHT